MTSLCKYKDILGVPRLGFHKARIPYFDVARNDVLGTLALGVILWLILRHFKIFNDMDAIYQLIISILIAFALGVVAHWLFCVDTTFNRALGLVSS